MKQVLEIVIYKLKNGINETDFYHKGIELEENFLKKQKGFIKRTFARSEKEDWVDVVYWETMEDAMRTSEAAMKSPICAPMFEAIDDSSVKMHHFEILNQ